MARMTKERGTNKQQGFWRLVHFPVKLSDRNYGEGEASLNRQQGKRGWNMEKKVNLNGLILLMIVYPRRDGPHPEVVQYWGNPWGLSTGNKGNGDGTWKRK